VGLAVVSNGLSQAHREYLALGGEGFLLGDGLFISDGPIWKQRRAIVAPIVHASRMDQFAPVMVEAAAETAERWRAMPPGSPIDALREMGTLTAEIICRTIFGPRLGSEHATEIVASFAEYQRQIGQIDLTYMLGLPDWLPRWYPRSVRNAAGRIHAILDGIIAEARGSRSRGEEAMIHRLLEARDRAGRYFRLEDCLDTLRRTDLEAAADELLDRLVAHTGRRLDDDVAVLLFEAATPPAQREDELVATAASARVAMRDGDALAAAGPVSR